MRAGAAWLALSLLAGCSGGTLPGRAVEISGNGLSYQSAPDGFSGSDRFIWTVTSSSVYFRYDQTEITHGKVTVVILDGLNQSVVDSSPPIANGPIIGAPGDWQVRIDYSDAVGVFHMDAQGSH